MEDFLDPQRGQILSQTRHVLGDLRDVLGDTQANEADRLALAESIRQLDELFLLVVAGEFNAGKSAFINALLGQRLLSEGVTPTTAQIHILRHGETSGQSPAGRGMLLVTAPIELLKNINIVDTPGTNAILREHEALTAEFIPRSDLVLFLTSADRPFTESERAFLTQIRDWGKKIVLIVNKVDILPDENAVDEVLAFVTQAGQKLVGEIAAVFPVSARQAQKAKTGEPRLWSESGFEPLEQFIESTLDDTGRFQLKLLNPLGVAHKLVRQQLASIAADLDGLAEDNQLLGDIQQQSVMYDEDMQRNFQARLSEIDNLLFEMERRGNQFFDETIRLGRVFDLMRASQIKAAYEAQVVAETPRQIESRVSELVDWLVEQDLRQWTAVAESMNKRRQVHEERIIGQGGPREGTLAYDRQRLIDSIGKDAERAVAAYDRAAEAERLANGAREAVAGSALAGLGGVGLGVIIATMGAAAWDVTGIAAGLAGIALGLFILPARRRRAKQELADKLADLRDELVNRLTEQFQREMRRSAQRVEDIVAPFSRFVRAEQSKIAGHQARLQNLSQQIDALRHQVRELTPVAQS